MIVVAHRLSTIRNCDRIVVLRDGEIVEEGSHEILLNKGGIYKNLVEKQLSHLEKWNNDYFRWWIINEL